MNIRKIKLEDSTQLFNWVNKTDSLSVKIGEELFNSSISERY